MKILSTVELEHALGGLAGWSVVGGQLSRTVQCPSLAAAVELVTRMAHVADARDHHPDFLLRSGQVTVSTWTHDAGNAITARDTGLAAALQPLLDAVAP